MSRSSINFFQNIQFSESSIAQKLFKKMLLSNFVSFAILPDQIKAQIPIVVTSDRVRKVIIRTPYPKQLSTETTTKTENN